MEANDWVAIVVGVLSFFAALLAGNSARKAARYNADASVSSARAQAETEAYNRARAMDIATIKRQDDELEELSQKYKTLQGDYEGLIQTCRGHREELDQLRATVERLQKEKET